MPGHRDLLRLLALLLLAAATSSPGAAAAKDPAFSVVVLPDTQYYSRLFPEIYQDQTSWILKHRASDGIRFVLHMGDLTDTNDVKEWARASKAHETLDLAGVPYAVLPGNHDYPQGGGGHVHRGDLARFNGHFGRDRFNGQAWYGGNFDGGNENNYALFEAGGLRFLAVNLEFAPRKDVLCWANHLADKYADRRVIVSTHCYQDTAKKGESAGGHRNDCSTGYRTIGAGGDDTWRELVRRQNNIFLVLSGHIHGSEHMQRLGLTPGHTVEEILTDYQSEPRSDTGQENGNGWLRELRFRPSANTVDVSTETAIPPSDPDYRAFFPDGPRFYAPYYDASPSASDHHFSFSYDMTSPLPAHNGHTALFEPYAHRTVAGAAQGQMRQPAVTVTGAGATVAWEDDRDGNHLKQIHVRGFDPTGCERFSDRVVNTVAKGQQLAPDLASDRAGNFVVVWQDDQDGDGKFDIYARTFKADGTPRTTQLRVNPNSSGQHLNPRVASDATGNFVVVWEDESDGSGHRHVRARGYTATGVERIAPFTASGAAAGEQRAPAIAMIPSGAFVVAWQDDTDGNKLYQIEARGFEAAGKERFSKRTVNAVSTGQQKRPAVASDSMGRFVVAWEDDRDGNGSMQILARGFTAGGAERFPELTVNTVAAGQQLRPRLAMDADGNFAVVWEDDQDRNGIYQVLVRGFGADGKERFPSTRLNAAVRLDKDKPKPEKLLGASAPAIGMAAKGNFVAAWQDDFEEDGVTQIVARGLNPLGGAD